MMRTLTMIPLLGLAAWTVSGLDRDCIAEKPMCRLPTPDYHPDRNDPDWLAYAAQFHGHLGPWATAGLRIGMAGLRAVQAKGYFDVEVTAEGPMARPPQSCFLDGLQVSTGATLGKRNLRWVKADGIAVRLTNRRTGRTAELRPTRALMELLGSFRAQPRQGHEEPARHHEEAVEAIARKIARMPESRLLTITFPGEETSGGEASGPGGR